MGEVKKFNNTVMTNIGRKMLTSIASGNRKINYTKAEAYAQDVSNMPDEVLRRLTSLQGKELSANLRVSNNNDNVFTLTANFENKDLTSNAVFHSIGWFARLDADDAEQGITANQEYLIGITPANGAQTLVAPPADRRSSQAISLNLNMTLSDAAKVDMTVSDAGTVHFNELDDQLTQIQDNFDKKIANCYTKQETDQNLKNLKDQATAYTDTTVGTKFNALNNQLAGYTPTSDLNKLLAGKADLGLSYTKAELDAKLLAVTTDTSGKVSTTQVASMIADKADKTYVDNQIASIDFGKIKFRKQYVNSDGQTTDKTWSATKNKDGTYTIDLWQDDWTASKLSDVLAQLPNKADTSTVNAQIADAKNTIKSNVDNLQSAINTKANASDVYTKSQTDGKLGQKITFVKCDSPQAAHDASTKPAADGSIVLGIYDMNDEPSEAYVAGQKINIEWLYNHLTDLQSTVNSGLATKANQSDLNSTTATVESQASEIASLKAQLNDAVNQISYIKANYVEGRRFTKSQEAQAVEWENENPQRIAFITDD